MKLYLDTAPLIYAIEEVAPWAQLVQVRISLPGVQVVPPTSPSWSAGSSH